MHTDDQGDGLTGTPARISTLNIVGELPRKVGNLSCRDFVYETAGSNRPPLQAAPSTPSALGGSTELQAPQYKSLVKRLEFGPAPPPRALPGRPVPRTGGSQEPPTPPPCP